MIVECQKRSVLYKEKNTGDHHHYSKKKKEKNTPDYKSSFFHTMIKNHRRTFEEENETVNDTNLSHGYRINMYKNVKFFMC